MKSPQSTSSFTILKWSYGGMKKQYANSNSYEIKLAAPAAPPVHHKRRNGFKVKHRFTPKFSLEFTKTCNDHRMTKQQRIPINVCKAHNKTKQWAIDETKCEMKNQMNEYKFKWIQRLKPEISKPNYMHSHNHSTFILILPRSNSCSSYSWRH